VITLSGFHCIKFCFAFYPEVHLVLGMHDRQPPEDEAVRGHCVEHPGQWEHRTQETGGEAEQGSDGHNPANKRPSNLKNKTLLLSCSKVFHFNFF
jgi:hypothetical protein